MEQVTGSCRFGLWTIEVVASGNLIHRVKFTSNGSQGPVPEPFLRFLAGKSRNLSPLTSVALLPEYPYEPVYQVVSEIPYGCTATYGEIAEIAGTIPRLVGLAMKRNPTPILIPCHRVVARDGIGGYTPSVDIKEELIRLEQVNKGNVKD